MSAATVSEISKRVSTDAGFSMGGLSLWQAISRVWNSAVDDEIFDRAAELAYYFLFALFPALIFLSAMFGMFTSTKTQANLELMLYLGKVIPPGAFNMVTTVVASTTGAANTGKIAFGAITALWAATYGMSSAQSTLNCVYRVKESRPYWKAKAIALLLMLVLFVLVFSAMLLLILGNYLAKLVVDYWLMNSAFMMAWKFVQILAALFFLSLVFSLTYHWGPNRRGHKWRWISPGAAVGIAGWLAISIGFRIYLHFFNNYAILYGSMGTVIVLLTWFYVSGLMLLLGAEINVILAAAIAENRSAKS